MNKEPIEIWVRIEERQHSDGAICDSSHDPFFVKKQIAIILSQEEWDETEMNRMALDLSCETISQLTIKNQEKDKEIERLKELIKNKP